MRILHIRLLRLGGRDRIALYLQIGLNLLATAYYHEWRSLIGYATHYLFRDR